MLLALPEAERKRALAENYTWITELWSAHGIEKFVSDPRKDGHRYSFVLHRVGRSGVRAIVTELLAEVKS